MMQSIIVIGLLSWAIIGADAIRFGRVLPPKVENLADFPELWFPQILDHSSDTHKTWRQRFYLNKEFFGGGDSPVFLLVGGEGEIASGWMQGGAWFEWAAKYKALMIQLEHRFYGKSHPTADTSVDNLKYLTSQQALADIAYFIKSINQANNFTSNKWILFGGSYPGNLVAWARLKYPHLVYGGISSSGPYEAELNFKEYNDVVRESLNTYSSGCGDQVTKAIKTVQKYFQSDEGLKTLKQKMGPCRGFRASRALDRAAYVQGLTGPVSNAVQYDKQLENDGMEQVCSCMNDKSIADPLDRLVKYYRSQKNHTCIYSRFKGNIGYYKQTSWDAQPNKKGDRQWTFQTCNEFGYFQTSDTPDSFLSDTVPLDYDTKLCSEVFGSNYDASSTGRKVDKTNRYYGGTDIQVKHVVFIQGTVDPWHALGMIKNPTSDSPLLLVKGTSHCYDMLAPQAYDPPSLTAARNTAEKNLDKWLL